MLGIYQDAFGLKDERIRLNIEVIVWLIYQK